MLCSYKVHAYAWIQKYNQHRNEVFIFSSHECNVVTSKSLNYYFNTVT